MNLKKTTAFPSNSLSKTIDRSRSPSRSVPSRWLLLTALAVALLGAACQRQSRQPSVDQAPEIKAELQVNPQPAAVGSTELEITLTDGGGQPVEGAAVSVRGDMSHAGMVPVFGEAEEVEPGRYLVPFEWTMGGEWIVTASIELADGRQTERIFNLSVASEG